MTRLITKQDLINTQFYQVPKWLFDMFVNKKISQGGFKTYVLMYDRIKLSYYNNWIDEEGIVYIKFSYDELQNKLNCSRQAVSDNLKKLEELDLIDKKRQFNSSSIFYLKVDSSLENLTNSSLENLTNSSLENLTNSSLENLDANNNNINKNKKNNNNILSVPENNLYNPLKSINCTKRTNYNVQNVQIKLHEMYNNKESINKENNNKENIYISVPELTQEQINKLNEKYPDIDIEYYIEKIKDYEERKNKKYSSYYLTLLNWIKRDIERNNTYSKIVTIKEKENKEVENELNFDF